MVGRWTAYHNARGKLINPEIDNLPAISGERLLAGWHYLWALAMRFSICSCARLAGWITAFIAGRSLVSRPLLACFLFTGYG